MRLTRLIVRRRGENRHVQGDYCTNLGKKVRLNHGVLHPNDEVRVLIEQIEAAAGDLKALRGIDGV